MTTAPPPAHYGAVEGALASGFATAELHHLWGHDLVAPDKMETGLIGTGPNIGSRQP